MELYESQAFVTGCFRDEGASCACVCPFHLDVRSFLKKAAKKRWSAAYRDLGTAIPFPTVAAKLCPAPCEGRCQRTLLGDEPLNLRAIELLCAERTAGEKGANFPIPAKQQRIVVLGAGPAGLACALALSRKKYAVTVFDPAETWGGHLRESPDYPIFSADFEKQFGTQDTEFRFGSVPEEAELSAYDAVYVATGEGGSDFGLLPSWNAADFTTARPGWFLGGGLCGMPLMESMAAGSRLSQLMEAYLQTGRAALIVEGTAAACDGHFVAHPGEESKPRIAAASPDGAYTPEEGAAEASRCMQCICDECMDGCELMRKYRKTPYKLAASISGDSHTSPPFSNCEATRETFSCNLCGVCSETCPEGIDLGALFRFSREDRWAQNKSAPALYDFWLREMDFRGGEGFFISEGTCSLLFFPGCALTAACPDHTLSLWKLLKERENAGILLSCCGAPSVWAGDKVRTAKNLALLRESWERAGKPRIAVACATCERQLREQLPEAEIVSVYEILAGMADAPSAPLPYTEAAVFDPCAARPDSAMKQSIPVLAARAGCTAEPLPDGGKCCGFGGHMRLANPELFRQIAGNRASESEKPYLVYCANCLEVFLAQGKPAVHILDAVFGPHGAPQPTLGEKHANVLRVKAALLAERGETFVPTKNPWDGLALRISEDARRNMEEKLISDDDLRETVFTAEASGEYFTDDTGLHTACLIRKYLVYWADYRMEDGTAVIENAYCHRMHFGEEGT